MTISMNVFSNDTVSHTSSVNHLKKIYTLEDEKVTSVFFEFIESTYSDNVRHYMNNVCYQASKMDLSPDRRIPLDAKQGFCFGFTAKKGEKVQKLIESVESAMTWSSKPKYEVEVTSIDASMLIPNPYNMPAKDYSDVFCCYVPSQWT